MAATPPPDEGAEVRALIVALATGARLSLPDEQLAQMAAEHLIACIPPGNKKQAKDQAIRLYARVIAEQNRLLVEAMSRWNVAVGGDPAGTWMAQLAAAVARGRAGIPTDQAPASSAQTDPGKDLFEGGADALAAAVQLISTHRTTPSTSTLGHEVVAVIAGLSDRNPGGAGRAVAWLVGQLVSLAAHACDQWDKADGGTPANTMLARASAHAESKRK